MKNNIILNILSSSSDTAVHVELCLGSTKDNGVLYFTNEEFDRFTSILRQSDAIVEIRDQKYHEYQD